MLIQWEEQKCEVMYQILVAKAKCSEKFREALLDSGNCTLVEGTSDIFWGIGMPGYYAGAPNSAKFRGGGGCRGPSKIRQRGGGGCNNSLLFLEFLRKAIKKGILLGILRYKKVPFQNFFVKHLKKIHI